MLSQRPRGLLLPALLPQPVLQQAQSEQPVQGPESLHRIEQRAIRVPVQPLWLG